MAKVKVTSRIPLANAKGKAGAERGVTLATEHVLTASRPFVPLEEGALERSGKAKSRGLHGEVSYGGDNATTQIVAIVQHERLDYRHAAGRTPKYLEGPLLAAADQVAQIIAAQVRRELR